MLRLLGFADLTDSAVREALNARDCFLVFCLRSGLLCSGTDEARSRYLTRFDVDVFRPLVEAYTDFDKLKEHQIDTLVDELKQLSTERTWRNDWDFCTDRPRLQRECA